ncbi:MAG: 30S ribosomal protein S12 methylthiotransferase RimO [Treponema sp.]|nr:30S ribosomal protein S12 methylthiotransferase RimO [Treponema sp.]
MSSYYIDPFGCVKNQVDAENMMAHLNKAGWENVTDAELAELIIVNSCGFIEDAKQESINAVLEWRKLYPKKKILLAGCLAQRYEKELSLELTEADGFMGVGDPAQIVKKASIFAKTKSIDSVNLQTGERPLLSLPGSAYVKISEGCNNRCSYCAIPLIRGSLVSRTIQDIAEECRALLNRGVRELCIIGQDIGAFGADTIAPNESPAVKLPELLNKISCLKGDFWVRLLYIHPDHFPLEILDIMEKDKRFLPYFDIPFQHAASNILAAMNRKGTAEKYLALLKTIRSRLPHAIIRSTFLLGFPGETEEDFAELLNFQKKAKLDWLGCFTFSREEGTAAFSMKNRVNAKTAKTRKQIIEQQQIPITEKNMDRFTSETLDVLVEERIAANTEINADSDLWLGRLYCQAPDIDGAAVIVCNNGEKLIAGTFAKCKVTARRGFDLEVQVVV